MRINHNIAALNTHRQLSTNTVNQGKNIERLSSGLRINRAADDAAGLSISEKMRSQIRGLDQAVKNAQDGISFIQTAEGATNEISSMLVRLKELSVQVTNGTYNSDDKANIGREMKALGEAANEIIVNTKFNGTAVFTAAGGTDIKYGEDASLTVNVAALTKTAFEALKTASDAAEATPAGVTVTLVEAAITELNTERAKYGAMQNKLEHVINNMSTTGENLQAAESRIRDVDYALAA